MVIDFFCSIILVSMDYGHTKVKTPILCGQNSNPRIVVIFFYKGLVFFTNNGRIMENLDNGLTVPKWVMIIWPKMPKMPQNLAAQFVCPNPKVLDFNEKRLHWAYVVRVRNHSCPSAKLIDKKSPACLHT